MELVIVPPEPAKALGAVCLDGTAPAYWIKKFTAAESNSSWVVHLEGGGWCFKETDCLERSNGDHGSSDYLPKELYDGGLLDENPETNPLFSTWNHVTIAYCDGGSFSGDRDEPVVVSGKPLFFRGIRILKHVLNELLETQKMKEATNIIITGCSAGGLSSLLHSDFITSFLLPRMINPSRLRLKVAPFSGLFLDLPNAENKYVYESEMKRMFLLQNASGSMLPECIQSFGKENAWKCIFPENSLPFIKSNLFIVNSLYDSWTSNCIFIAEPVIESSSQNGNCTAIPEWIDCITNKRCDQSQISELTSSWGKYIKQTISISKTIQKRGNGAFIFSCYDHCGECGKGWNNYFIDTINTREAVTKWFFSNNEESSLHTHIDCLYSNDMCCNPSCC